MTTGADMVRALVTSGRLPRGVHSLDMISDCTQAAQRAKRETDVEAKCRAPVELCRALLARRLLPSDAAGCARSLAGVIIGELAGQLGEEAAAALALEMDAAIAAAEGVSYAPR